ncbi:hypothetical protein GPA19_07170 [Azoarcus indigens]|uniref:Membrane protein n=1 Tax=Azoarcus indigens TaxID=29545 RepID=A0A4R6E1J9_9RHOO|nr:YihY/virulence factor BrkB family protein [Azoarcus indigens]NMG64726.1 hypothetical protein [Azoarcus indigens]TDN50889.1 membrane protein [Azoarcus indigens]
MIDPALWKVPLRAGQAWAKDRCTTYAAALAYYAAFALAPILVIAVAVAGLVFGQAAVEGRVVAELGELLGAQGAALVQRLLAASYESGSGFVAGAVALFSVALGASALFMEMGAAFERIFRARRTYKTFWLGMVLQRLRALTVIVGVGFLLMVSLIASAAIVVVGQYLTQGIASLLWVAWVLQAVIALLMQAGLFAIIYKVLAPIPLRLKTVFGGAMVTAMLFEVGKWGIGLYLGRASVSTTFGAAGSLAVILVWVYYVSMILLYGAEVTRQLHRVHELRHRQAQRLGEAARAA